MSKNNNGAIDVSTQSLGNQPIEIVQEKDLAKLARDEAFMNEIVTIYVMRTNQPGELSYVEPIINGVKQFIFKGRNQKVKRKVVEALAHSKLTVFNQSFDVADIHVRNRLNYTTALAYPFHIVQDNNPAGAAWFEHLMSQPG